MTRSPLPNIASVAVLSGHVLVVRWRGHAEDRIDLTELVAQRNSLAPLRKQAAFAAAEVGEEGWSVVWRGGIELDADFLYRLARYQAGDSLTPEDFLSWRVRNKLSQAKAALALGISLRMVKYYEDGNYLIPRTVRLACLGYESLKDKEAA
ncbi:MAG: DUF2442 domain-containing protein [Rhodospirillales bacterium]|nr:MAG: DUF2442 domain-containing protein [Rhodospirillales bacterium]